MAKELKGFNIQGLIHAVAVTTTNITDRAKALQAIDRCAPQLDDILNILVDAGYTGETFANAVEQRLGANVEVAKRNERHNVKILPKRWVCGVIFCMVRAIKASMEEL